MASGKSTVAEALARRLPRAAHVRGDTFRRFIVSGAAPITPEMSPEARAQLELRYRLSAHAGDAYVAAGFTAIVQDVVLGPWLERYLEYVQSRPLHVVVLNPSPAAIAAREAARPKTGYKDGWGIEASHRDFLATTPRLGLWLDTSALSVDKTVDTILADPATSLVRP